MTMRETTLVALSVLSFLVACDEKKPEPDKAKPAATPSAVIPAPPAASEVAHEEEAPVKKEPKVCKPGSVVDFDGNAALEAQVRLKTAKEKGDVTVADLAKVKSINLSQSKVDELDPCIFPHFKNMKELFLGPGKVEDLSPIAGLKNLEALRASLNRVSDLKPLSELSKMDRLDLGHTRVMDITPLANLTELSDLQLDDTAVSDLKALSECKKLERLSIQRTNVKDLAPLRGLDKLKFVYTSGAPIQDKFALAPLVTKGLKVISE
jgi:internalin A